MKILIYVICFFSVKASAITYDLYCKDLSNAQVRLEAHTSNIINSSTTRTPQGGHYKKLDVICKKGSCTTEKSLVKKIVYEPGHPDADKRGYVKYPDIDVKAEYSQVNMAVSEIKALAYKGACRMQVLQTAETIIVKYKSGNILSDIFKIGKNHEIISWARTFFNGKNKIYDYSSRIDKQKFATNSFAF